MNHDRLFHKGTGTVQSKKLYFVLSIVIVLGVTICFFWRVWHTSDRLVTIHGEIITSQAVDMYSQIDTIGRTDLKVIGFLDNKIISCYWIQNARTLSNAAQEEEFEELLVTADYKSGDTRLIRRTNTSPISSVDPFLFDFQTLYSFPFRNGTVSIIMTDLVTGTTETLLRDAAAATSLVGFAKVDQDTAAFLVTADSQLQMVLLWNRSTERLLEIFNTANLSLERPPQITAIASDGTYLYYLMKEMDGSNWLQCNSINGSVLWRKNLALPEYEDAQYTADQLYIQDQTFFIKWYNCGSAPYFTVLQKEDTEFSRLPIPQCTPCYLLTPHPIAEEWLLFSTFPEQQAYLKKDFAHLVLYNLKTATWQSVRLDMGTETNYRLFANETGNVISQIYAENGDNTKLIQYPCANLIK